MKAMQYKKIDGGSKEDKNVDGGSQLFIVWVQLAK